jgi:hypothetical protein
MNRLLPIGSFSDHQPVRLLFEVNPESVPDNLVFVSDNNP